MSGKYPIYPTIGPTVKMTSELKATLDNFKHAIENYTFKEFTTTKYKQEYECTWEPVEAHWQYTLVRNGRYCCEDCYKKVQPEWKKLWSEGVCSGKYKSACCVCGVLSYNVKWVELPQKLGSTHSYLIGAIDL